MGYYHSMISFGNSGDTHVDYLKLFKPPSKNSTMYFKNHKNHILSHDLAFLNKLTGTFDIIFI